MHKSCSNCGAVKPHTDFQVRKLSKDGLTASCKTCLRERDRIRNKSQSRIDAREAYAKGVGKDKADAAKKRYIERNPKKRKVHVTVGNALRDGILVKKPCEVCGDSYVEAHHCDYDKPLEVMFLCPKHHQAWHDQNGPGLNGD